MMMTLSFSAPFGYTVTDGPSAARVIGQKDFVSSLNPPNSLRVPTNVVFDSAGNLWVSDELNSRVLEFELPFSTGMSAASVIGQANFSSSSRATTQSGLNAPSGEAFDSAGNLWVADLGNNRVLEYLAPLSS